MLRTTLYQILFFSTPLVAASFLISGTARADKGGDFYIEQSIRHYFMVPRDARSLALSGATVASCDDVFCIYQNPALLPLVRDIRIAGSLDDRKINGEEFPDGDGIEALVKSGSIGLAFPLSKDTSKEHGTIAAAYSRYLGTVTDRISSTPDGHTRALGFGYGKDFALGYSFIFYDDQLHSDLTDAHSHARFLHTFGLYSSISSTISAAGVFRLGIGQTDTEEFSTEADGVSHLKELLGEIGIRYKSSPITLNIGVDFAHLESEGNLTTSDRAIVIGGDEEGDYYNIRLGGESFITEAIALRVGVRWRDITRYRFERTDLSELSGRVAGLTYSSGLGYTFTSGSSLAGIRIDYGVEYGAIESSRWWHALTFSAPLS